MRSEIKTDLNSIIGDIRDVCDLPLAVGFGINTPEQSRDIAKIADGVIVGSAIVKIIEEHGENAAEPLKEYVSSMKKAANEWFLINENIYINNKHKNICIIYYFNNSIQRIIYV